MSRENVERVVQGFEAFNRGDIEGVVAMCDPGVEWLPPAELPDFAPHHGHEGVREAAADMLEVFGRLRADPERVIDAGDQVVVLFRWRGLGRGSGVPVDFAAAEQGAVFDMRDGKAVRVVWFTNPREALEAVPGLDQEAGR
jgi:ketosteroid isomerase-like protein